ncbi:ankyrin repeat domain-containing protein 39-like [Sitophilus oryzae]|uniref:Ankyrin repeat domain-containing protein 39-like n=1 Tax=Sitophilus oryzae TaxID=7048 RepID=A0A6J2X6W8_SITOR|nr:ankyrin repeat domain-containing protein 39-like [Sitophilus oryzae]
MSHKDEFCEHNCGCTNYTAVQSLEEMDFVKGIWYAAQNGDYDRVQKLLESGKYNTDHRDSAGYTPLHYAARNGHLQVCKYLVQRGSDVNAVTKCGKATALHRACTAGKIDVVKFLISQNANVNLKDADGKTAFDRAVNSNHHDICNLLKGQDNIDEQ